MEPIFDVNKVMQVMSEILSDKYGVKIKMRAIPKPKTEEESHPATAQ